jgi:hypothetical protein
VNRPKLLDLFCCAGGAAMGYHRAGFDVTGVDIAPRPNYPFTFVQGDAIEYAREHGNEFDAIHASPPCQAKCSLTVGTNRSRGWGREHVDLVAPTREVLLALGRPYVIEQPNGGADLRKDVRLNGELFDLGVWRPRNFELGGWWTLQHQLPKRRGYVRGWRHGVYRAGPYVAAYGDGGDKASVPEMQAAMGIDWTDVREELTEAIPPAYTQWIGERLLEHLAAAGSERAA